MHIEPYEPGWDISVAGIDHGAEGCAVWDNYDPDRYSIVQNITTTRHGDNKYTFSIPLSSERYHFVSWGPIDKSSFQIVPVHSSKKHVVAEVEVLKDPRETARVCALPSKGDGDTYGVGIYSPRQPPPHPQEDWPAFKITVYIPTSDSRRNLGALETRLGQFEHILPDLSRSINFKRLHLGAVNVPISFESVVADEARVSNANGPISGNLTSASNIVISNANGPISGNFTSASNIVISNANAIVQGNLTLTRSGEIKIDNANKAIDVTVRLESDDETVPEYRLALANANAPITLTVAQQPTDSGFYLTGNNVAGAIRAFLHPAFEGEFKLTNLFRSPMVEFKNHKDPSGRGRERYLDFYQRGPTTKGSIRYGSPDEEHAPGSITLSTVAAPLEVSF